MIISTDVKKLVLEIESTPNQPREIQTTNIHRLINMLASNCQQKEIAARYENYFATDYSKISAPEEQIGSYPIDTEGYAMAFDPLTQEQEIWDCWQKYGVTISKQVIDKELINNAIERMSEIVAQLSDGKFNIDDPTTHTHMPIDSAGTPFVSRGFMEIYHDDFLAQIRQSLRVYLHNVIIWGRADLWTTFDRVGVKLAGNPESKGLPLHVDQNALGNPHFTIVQGVLALSDCPKQRGTLVVVPGSRALFPAYGHVVRAGTNPEYRGEYVELTAAHPSAAALQKGYQILPLRSGCLASWDSRNTHANNANESMQARKVAYISSGVAKEYANTTMRKRHDAFISGQAVYDHTANLHVTKKPRYTEPTKMQATRAPEQLSPLGEFLYGQKLYNKILQQRSKKTLLLNAENFGYGPTAAIADFFPELSRRFTSIAFIGSGHSLDLQRSLAYDQIYDLTVLEKNQQTFSDIVVQYDVFMTASDFKFAAEAAALDIPTIIYDPLTWYWPQIPDVAQLKNVLYIAQEFLEVDDRLSKESARFALPYPVAPIVSQNLDVASEPVRDIILLNMGGISNPYWPEAIVLKYAKIICTAMRAVLPVGTNLVIACNQQIASSIGGTNYSREQIRALLPQVKLAFITPGLGNIYEMAAHNIPAVYLPPANDSQAMQALMLQRQSLLDYYIDWQEIIGYKLNYDIDQQETLQEIAKTVSAVVADSQLQEKLQMCLYISYQAIKDQISSKSNGLISKFGTGGKQQIAAAVQSFSDAYRPGRFNTNKKLKPDY